MDEIRFHIGHMRYRVYLFLLEGKILGDRNLKSKFDQEQKSPVTTIKQATTKKITKIQNKNKLACNFHLVNSFVIIHCF